VTERLNGHHDSSVKSRAEYLNQLRPHVSIELAIQAVDEIDALIAEGKMIGDNRSQHVATAGRRT
jgi:hypothetical protein